jgi:hypothetical protein
MPDLPQALQRADIAAPRTPRAAPWAAKIDENLAITRQRAL